MEMPLFIIGMMFGFIVNGAVVLIILRYIKNMLNSIEETYEEHQQ